MLPLRVSDSDFNMHRQERYARLHPRAPLVRALAYEPSRRVPGAQFDLNPSANGVVV